MDPSRTLQKHLFGYVHPSTIQLLIYMLPRLLLKASHIFTRHDASLRRFEPSCKRLEASWMRRTACKDSDLMLDVLSNHVFNEYASTTLFERVLDVFENVFEPS